MRIKRIKFWAVTTLVLVMLTAGVMMIESRANNSDSVIREKAVDRVTCVKGHEYATVTGYQDGLVPLFDKETHLAKSCGVDTE